MDFTLSKREFQDLCAHKGDILNTFERLFEKQLHGELNESNIQQLNSAQITLYAYICFRREMQEGGMIQLIYNGYGTFIFLNPFAKALRLWGLKDFSKFIYAMRELYMVKRDIIEGADLSEDDFMALYEQHPEFDDFDDEFIELEPIITKDIISYIANNLFEFNIKEE